MNFKALLDSDLQCTKSDCGKFGTSEHAKFHGT